MCATFNDLPDILFIGKIPSPAPFFYQLLKINNIILLSLNRQGWIKERL